MKREFVLLIEKHQGLIYKVCKLYRNSREDVEDLFQDIVLELWRSYPRFRQESRVTTWMYRVAFCTAIARYKGRKEKVVLEEMPPGPLPAEPRVEPDYERQERIEWLYRAIDTLSEVEKAIVLLHLEDHTYPEIADIIGISESNAAVKLNRIKTKLKKFLNLQYDAAQ